MASEMESQANLKKLRGTRRKPISGDVFSMQLPTEKFLFGIVRFANPPRENAPAPCAYLIYIYDLQSSARKPDYSKMLSDHLLIPPLWTNQMPWTKGYFQHIENRPLPIGAAPRNHCFRVETGKFVDENGKRINEPSAPFGEWGIVSYRWIDDHISDALGIQRVPGD
jgi:hypothetical protein